jgi:hypothetical protein
MNWRYTPHQVPRAARVDAESFDKLLLIKNVSMLRATYQIRLLLFRAIEGRKKLVIVVPKHCSIHRSLRELTHDYSENLRIERAA